MTSIRLFAAAALAIAATCVHAQSKSIVFSTPTTQSVLTINLVDNQPVTIGANGNMAAQCTPNQAGTQCANIPTGGGGTPATASLPGNPPSGQTGITPGTQVLLTPASDGAVCLRRSTPGTTWATTVFGSALLAPFGNQIPVTLSSGNTTYLFEMQCYGAGGVSSTVSWTGTTAQGGGGGPGPNCANVSPPSGFTRTGITSFQQLQTTSGTTPGLFPSSGSAFAALSQNRLQYSSIAFTVPAVADCSLSGTPTLCRSGEFDWNSINLVSYLNPANSYVTISECPGDFRIPPTGTAPAADPTFSQGCRNWRNGVSGFNSQSLLGWTLISSNNYQPSPQSDCHLESGKTYYFNLILDGPADGAITTDGSINGCELAGVENCGMGLIYYQF